MKKTIFLGTLLFLSMSVFTFTSCGANDEKDMNPPVIDGKTIVAVPENCQIFQRGSVIPFQYRFTDNIELGNYSITIHNNFDHHSHTGETEECDSEHIMDATEIPDSVWHFSQSFSIPDGSINYTARQDIEIPTNIAEGDYHLMIELTDKSGWKAIKKVSIKIKDAIE